jgi:ABC-type branched-subunit amino acid transport system permease subunit
MGGQDRRPEMTPFFNVRFYPVGSTGRNAMGPIVGSLCGLVVCGLVAAIFGYFVFYGRVQNWIVPILTLVLTLLLETFLGQTAGYQWRVGSVQLGGYNGMTGIPAFRRAGPKRCGQEHFDARRHWSLAGAHWLYRLLRARHYAAAR